MAAQVDDDLEGTNEDLDIPDYNNIDGIANPSNLEKVVEDDVEADELDNTMHNRSVQKLIKTPKAQKSVQKNKLAPASVGKKAATAKSEDLKSIQKSAKTDKSDKKTDKSAGKSSNKRKSKSVMAGP